MNIVQEQGLAAGASLDALMKALGDAPQIMNPTLPEALAKSTFAQSGSATTGLTFYDLEAGAKFLYPVLTPLRNEIPRVSGKGGIQANWKAVTGINTSGIRIGVSGGNRGAVMAVTVADYAAAYKGIGIEDNVDFEAQYAGQGFEDIRAIAAKVGLEALMLGEELLILGGDHRTRRPLRMRMATRKDSSSVHAPLSRYARRCRAARTSGVCACGVWRRPRRAGGMRRIACCIT